MVLPCYVSKRAWVNITIALYRKKERKEMNATDKSREAMKSISVPIEQSGHPQRTLSWEWWIMLWIADCRCIQKQPHILQCSRQISSLLKLSLYEREREIWELKEHLSLLPFPQFLHPFSLWTNTHDVSLEIHKMNFIHLPHSYFPTRANEAKHAGPGY